MIKELCGIICFFACTVAVARAETVALSQADELVFGTENGKEIVKTKDGELFTGATILNDEENREMTYFYKNGQKNGTAVSYFADNHPELEITYASGRKNGEEILFSSNKQPIYKKTYKDDVLDGEEVLYHRNGKPQKQSFYKQGKLDGEVNYFDEDGNFIKIEHYQDGIKNGIERLIENNNLREEYVYKDGKKNGIGKKYDEKYLIAEISYKDDLKDGLYKTYAEDGSRSETQYRNDKKNGMAQEFYPNGNVASKTIYLDDKRNGISESFYESGMLADMSSYKNDKKDGITRKFNDRGELLKVTYYIDDIALSEVNIAANKEIKEIYDNYLEGHLNRFSNRRSMWYKILWLGLNTNKLDILTALEKEMKMFARKIDDISVYKSASGDNYDSETRQLYFGLTPFSYAVNLSSSLEVLQKFSSQLETMNARGTNALQEAVRLNNLDMVQYLLLLNPDMNGKDSKGNNIFMYALKNNVRPEILAALISAGADVNEKDSSYRTPLMLVLPNSLLAEELIKAGADVNVKDAQGLSPLANAMSYPETAVKLIAAGADVNAKDREGNPLLFSAYRNPELLNAFLKAGADINAKDKDGNTLLIRAIDNKDEELFATLAENAVDLKQLAPDGRNLLFYAYDKEAPQSVIKRLLDAEKDVNIKDKEGNTLLMTSLQKNDENMIIKLLASGADVNAVSANGESAVSYVLRHEASPQIIKAVFDNNVDVKNKLPIIGQPVWKVLMEQNKLDLLRKIWNKMPNIMSEADINGEIPFYSVLKVENNPELRTLALSYVEKADAKLVFGALENNDLELFKIALAKGADVNLQDEKEDSLLLYLLKHDYGREYITALLEHKPNVSAEDKNGKNALDLAIENNDAELAKMLLEAGANKDKLENGESYLMRLSPQQKELTEILLAAGADVNVVSANRKTLLMYAVENLNMTLFNALLENGADVALEDDNGNTALFYVGNAAAKDKDAAKPDEQKVKDMKEIISVLLEKGLDINKQNGDGETVLIRIAKYGTPYFDELAEFLQQNGAKAEIKDQYSKTALMYRDEKK